MPIMEASTPKGVLFLVSGPNGAGKDAVIDGARRRLAGDGRFVFPLRTITRPEGFGGEIHVAVTPAQFDRLRRRGAFALCWGRRGLNYAIPATIDGELAAGRHVVVNVAPAAFPEARARYAEVVAVWLSAAVEKRRQWLEARGRESLAEIEERLVDWDEPPGDEEIEVLTNGGTLDEAVNGFVALLEDRVGGGKSRPLTAGRALEAPGSL